MTGSVFTRMVGLAVSGSLLLGSTAAVAATSAQPSPWAVLTAMSGGAPAAAVCGAAAAATAAQTPAGGCVLPALDAVPPPPPQPMAVVPMVPPAATGLGVSPLLLGLLAIAAGVAAIALIGGGKSRGNSPA